MADLVVPAGTTLQIDASFVVAPQYDVFKMGANSVLRTSVDLTIRAGRAEFDANCLIDARGAAGFSGATAPNAGPFQNGLPGGNGGPGQRGSHVRIKAALAKVGGLTVITDGGQGGVGGAGGRGGDSTNINQGPAVGGPGGMGGTGGRAGLLTLEWVRAAPGLPKTRDTAPAGHLYRSDGGAGGPGGPGGMGGQSIWAGIGPNGSPGMPGPSGLSGTPSVTWYSDPTAMLWAQAQDIGPAPRTSHSAAYDEDRNRLVLFGGRDGSTHFDDTWEWDGKLWTQVGDTGPTGRANHAMAFDPTSRRVLLFGGSRPDADDNNKNVYFNDTWCWDGHGWIQVADTGPSARRAIAMTGDPKRQRVVLFSGGDVEQQRNNATDDTWEWDGSSWTQVQDTGPQARLGAAMTFDKPTGTVVLFGGAAGALLSDTWTWDGQLWKQVADTGPNARMGHGMASLNSGTILFGGLTQTGAGAELKSDTWLWLDGAWRLIQDMGPAARQAFALATVGQGGDEVPTLFGGEGSELYQDTWCFKERA